jgi:hydrogenase-4 component F
VLIATPFVLIQWNLKRLLAYSSIEHVGIMALGVGLGVEVGVFGALLHMTYHSLAKPVALFSAGTLGQLHGSSDFNRIGTGTFARAPIASGLLVLAAVIITGSPPFGLFFSEMTILRAGFVGAHETATSVFLAALIVLFCGFAFQIGRLVLGSPRDPAEGAPVLEHFDLGLGTAVVAAVLAIVSAFYLPSSLMALIRAATQVVWSGA